MAKQYSSVSIKAEALRLGFSFCGVSKADFLETEAPKLEQWLANNHHGEMAYMANHFDKRLDPRKLVEGAKSVLSLGFSYYPETKPQDHSAPKIAKYAYGEDYHQVLKQKLKELMYFIRQEVGEVGGRAFVDSAPVLEKAWAQRSGLGWVGKNTNLINKQLGSFFFLAELILDIDFEPDEPFQNSHCGTCTRCIDACPTQAIVAPYELDATKCISYLTIELKDAIPSSLSSQLDNWAFGCDVCQDVCPWNRFSKPHQESKFNPHPDMLSMVRQDWEELTEEVFQQMFSKSALQRAGLKKLKRQIRRL